MADSIALGIPGLSVPPGTHICGFYRGADERDEIVAGFLQAGFGAGDKCVCSYDATDCQVVVDSLTPHFDVGARIASGDLDVLCTDDVYLGRGTFSAQEMLGFWTEVVKHALGDGGFDFLRTIGEMTWSVSEVIGNDDLIGYESELNRFVPQYPQVLLCLYDLDRFSGALLVELMKTHPKVLLGGTVLENLYYLEPDEFMAARK